MNILFLGKKNDWHTDRALAFCKQNAKVEAYFSDWENLDFPEDAKKWNGDYIISYLCRWMVPQYVLEKASKAAINFHPGPSDYPGIGCVNFALYDNAKVFGVTAHHMAHPADSGKIIMTIGFPLLVTDDVESLLNRTHDYLLVLFYEVMNRIFTGKLIPESTEQWSRKAYTRKEFNSLFDISSDMSLVEVFRRARAVTYQEYGPIMGGKRVDICFR